MTMIQTLPPFTQVMNAVLNNINCNTLVRMLDHQMDAKYTGIKPKLELLGNWLESFEMYEREQEHFEYSALAILTIHADRYKWIIQFNVSYAHTVLAFDRDERHSGAYASNVTVQNISALSATADGNDNAYPVEANRRFVSALEGLIQKMVG